MFHKFPLIYMKNCIVSLRPLSLVILLACALAARAQAPDNPPSPDGGPPPGMDFPPPGGPPGFDGPRRSALTASARAVLALGAPAA